MTDKIIVPAFYEEDDVRYLFDARRGQYLSMHAAVFQRRKTFKLGDAVSLAAELPSGAFLAGEWFKEIVRGQKVSLYDVFFTGSDALVSTVNRIHNAPEGSYLHGYDSVDSLLDFKDGDKVMMTFDCPGKPSIRLMRVRWFSAVEDALDKAETTASSYALDNELLFTFSDDNFRRLTLYQTIVFNRTPFYFSVGMKMLRYQAEGLKVDFANGGMHGFYGDREREAAKFLKEEAKKAKALGVPAPQNVNGYCDYMIGETIP